MTLNSTAAPNGKSIEQSSTERTESRVIKLGTEKMRLIPGAEKWSRKLRVPTAQETEVKSKYRIICLADAIIRYPQGLKAKQTRPNFVTKKVRDVFVNFWACEIVGTREELLFDIRSIMRKAKVPMEGSKAVSPMDVSIEYDNIRA
jgi:hypothetical protein